MKRLIKPTLCILTASLLLSSCLSEFQSQGNTESNKSKDFSSGFNDFENSDISKNSDFSKDDKSEDVSDGSFEDESSEIFEKSEDIPAIEPSSSELEFSEEPSLDFPDDIVTIETAGERFADKFTYGEIIKGENFYQSEFVNVTLKEVNFEGKLYFVQDIYIKNIESFSVGFAGLKFGKKYNDFVYDMVEDYQNSGTMLVGAVNGDYCGLDGKGAIIRNGVLYGTGKAQYTVCVLYKNGIMRTIDKKHFNAEKELERGAWHAWDFGPSFVNPDGSPLSVFTERTSIRKSNPRTAIGYFETGHYCFVTAGGRAKNNAYGVSFKQIARFMSHLGCKTAYNLDGGQSAVMVFDDKIVNEKYQGTGRRISDIVFIADIPKQY